MVEFQDALVIAGVTLVVVVVLHLATFWVAKMMKPTPPPQPIIQYLPAPQMPAPSAVALPPQLPQLPPPTRIEQSAQAQQAQQGQPQLPAPIETRSLSFPENGAGGAMGGGGFNGGAGGGIYKETQTTIQLPSYATPSSAVPPQSAANPAR